MSTGPMADEAEFATFLETATVCEVAAQAFEMLGTLEKARDAVQDVEWSRVTRTFERMHEMAGPAAPDDAMRELGFALRAVALLAELDKALEGLAHEQHGKLTR